LRDCGLWHIYAHFPCETGFVVVATAAYRALDTETTVGLPHRVSPSGIRAGGRGQCVYACHRALESSMAQIDASDFNI